MQKILLFLLFCLFSLGSVSDNKKTTVDICIPDYYLWYTHMGLSDKVSYEAFEQAITGFFNTEGHSKGLLTLIDFTKPSTEKRLFVLDMRNKQLLFSSYVSHGRNSGDNYATSFSNEIGSFKSSLGFYLTDGTYQGNNGYSLLLNGLEKGINDKARERAIVIHGAPYANPSTIQYAGRLGRSLGCPALPLAVSKAIIDTIKGGSLLFIYANDQQYVQNSPILSADSYFS